MEIAELNLDVRDFNAVKRFGINSTGELLARLPDFCKEHRRTGAKVTEALHKLGLLPFHLGEWVEPEHCAEELAPEEFREGAFIIMGFPTESRDDRKVVLIIKIDGDQLWYIDGKPDILRHTIGYRTCWHIAEEIGDAMAKHREEVWEDVRVSEETEESAAPETAVNVPETLVQHDFLSLESDCFIELRQEFDAMLQKTLASMIRRDSDDATLTLKLHLRLDHTSDSLQRAVIRPDISHKITSAIMVKDDLNGRVNGDYELLYDAAAERYLLRELPPEEGQLSLL